MILAYNVELNKSILTCTNVVIDEAIDTLQRNAQLVENFGKFHLKAKHDVNIAIVLIAFGEQ